MARKQHQVRKTLLIVGEGDSEEAFLKHLRELYCSGGAGVAVTVRNAHGKGPETSLITRHGRPGFTAMTHVPPCWIQTFHGLTFSEGGARCRNFTYDGFPRVVEPNCCGTDKKGLGA